MTAPKHPTSRTITTGPDLDLDAVVDEVTAAVRDASHLALSWFRKSHEVENKLGGGFDPVTIADRTVEDNLRAALERRFPGHAVLGEERGPTGSGPYRWLIDPIDGTRSFVSGNPLWGTLLGLEHEGNPLAGWLHQPTMDETWIAAGSVRCHRSPHGERPLGTRDVTRLEAATVLCTTPEMFAGEEVDAFARVATAARLTRYGGDCINYGLLALGHADVVIDNHLAPYDIVPLIPILEAAGAVVTDRRGGPATGGGFVVAAGTPQLHAAVLARLGS